MLGARTYEELERHIKENRDIGKSFVGVIICSRNSLIGKEHFADQLEDYHNITGNRINIIPIGWFKYNPEAELVSPDLNLGFDPKVYGELSNRFTEALGVNYESSAGLFLVDLTDDRPLNEKRFIYFNIERMIDGKSILSIETLIRQINTWSRLGYSIDYISNSNLLLQIGQGLIKQALDILRNRTGVDLSRSCHYAVRG